MDGCEAASLARARTRCRTSAKCDSGGSTTTISRAVARPTFRRFAGGGSAGDFVDRRHRLRFDVSRGGGLTAIFVACPYGPPNGTRVGRRFRRRPASTTFRRFTARRSEVGLAAGRWGSSFWRRPTPREREHSRAPQASLGRWRSARSSRRSAPKIKAQRRLPQRDKPSLPDAQEALAQAVYASLSLPI
jgi:hypothetical protein